ncbi:MAG TPA: hypothetical protein VNT01_07135 [Symbiobacteriaceae bacterium]|nr:hypothetical protein [Symbiobacteriaceae bacterium]
MAASVQTQLISVVPKVLLVPVTSAPPIPSGLKITCLKDPNHGDPSDTCPVILWGDYMYWPLSYIDNRVAMCLVAYDAAKNVVGQWEMPGARYVVSAAVDENGHKVTFVGQANQQVSIAWSTMVIPPVVRLVPVNSAPPVPAGLKLTCLKDPNTLQPSDTCPVVVWGAYTYWPLSYIDNRVSLCLVAYDQAQHVIGQWELPGARYVVSATVNSANQTLTFLGQSSQQVSIAWNTMKVPPTIQMVPVGTIAQVPAGLKVTCLKDPNKLDPSDTCPIVAWGAYTYWPLSYIDNRVSMCLVAYDAAKHVAGQWEMPGARYVVSAAVNGAKQTITFVGQGSQQVSIGWNTINFAGPVPQ